MTTPLYYHYRKYSMPMSRTFASGRVIKLHRYTWQSATHSGFTVAAQRQPGNTLLCAVAVCSPSDVFDKARGRQLAHQRLSSSEGIKYRFSLELPDTILNSLEIEKLLEKVLPQIKAIKHRFGDFEIYPIDQSR